MQEKASGAPLGYIGGRRGARATPRGRGRDGGDTLAARRRPPAKLGRLGRDRDHGVVVALCGKGDDDLDWAVVRGVVGDDGVRCSCTSAGPGGDQRLSGVSRDRRAHTHKGERVVWLAASYGHVKSWRYIELFGLGSRMHGLFSR